MSVTMVDVMFARGYSCKFPTVAEVVSDSWASRYEFPDDVDDWLVVAQRPHALAWFDDAAQAIAETNWDVIAEHLPADAVETRRGYILVRPTAPEVADLSHLLGCLMDYPLLDEDAYSEREAEAWWEYAPTAFADEVTDALHAGDLDEEQAERLHDRAAEIVEIINPYLHYYNGFSGEYGPPMLSVLDSMADRPEVAALLAGDER